MYILLGIAPVKIIAALTNPHTRRTISSLKLGYNSIKIAVASGRTFIKFFTAVSFNPMRRKLLSVFDRRVTGSRAMGSLYPIISGISTGASFVTGLSAGDAKAREKIRNASFDRRGQSNPSLKNCSSVISNA
jgi:hypothetical protein